MRSLPDLEREPECRLTVRVQRRFYGVEEESEVDLTPEPAHILAGQLRAAVIAAQVAGLEEHHPVPAERASRDFFFFLRRAASLGFLLLLRRHWHAELS